MSKKRQKERKLKNREKRVKEKLLRRRLAIRAHRKLEKELEEIKLLQEEKIKPIRKDDTKY